MRRWEFGQEVTWDSSNKRNSLYLAMGLSTWLFKSLENACWFGGSRIRLMVECKDDNCIFCLHCLHVFFSVYSIRKDAEKPELGCWCPQREKGVAISPQGSCPIALWYWLCTSSGSGLSDPAWSVCVCLLFPRTVAHWLLNPYSPLPP